MIIKGVFAALAILLAAGCASVTEEEQVAQQREFAREQRMGEDMLDAFRDGDFDAFTQYIPAGGRQVYGKKEFTKEQQEIGSRMGKIVSYRFLTRLEMEPAHQLVWAVRFKSHTLKGDELYREALFTIVVGEVDERKRVFLFAFK